MHLCSPLLHIRSDEDARRIYDAFEAEFSEAFSPLVVNRPGGVYLDNFVLRVTVPTAKQDLPELPLRGKDPSAANRGSRPAFWPEIDDWADTQIYIFEELQPGNVVSGPAIVEAEDTTIVIEPGWSFTIDEYGNALLRHAKAKT